MAAARSLRNDRDLRSLHLERLEFAGAALRIRGGDGIPHDAHWRIIRHRPFRHPEVTFRLAIGLMIAHRQVDGLASEITGDHECGRAIALAGCWIDRRHAKSDRFAVLELVVEEAVLRGPWWVKVDDIAV